MGNQPSLNEYQMRPRYKFSNERTAAELRSSLKQALSSDANWPLQYKDTHGLNFLLQEKRPTYLVARNGFKPGRTSGGRHPDSRFDWPCSRYLDFFHQKKT